MGGGDLSELKHYGILGMKWGVRRFQNEDGSLTPKGIERYRKKEERIVKSTFGEKFSGLNKYPKEGVFIPKGSTVKRITTVKNEENKGLTYIATLDEDVTRYIANHFDLGDKTPGKQSYVTELKVTSDLIAPSLETVRNRLFKKLEGKTFKQITEELHGKGIFNYPVGDQLKKIYKNAKVGDCRDFLFNYYFAYTMRNKEKAKELIDDLKDMGYNAMIDYEDSGTGFTKQPIIVFERSENLKQTKASKITDDIFRKAQEENLATMDPEYKKKWGY